MGEHILFVQFGDYRAAEARLSSGETETYNSQFYSMRYAADLVVEGAAVTVIDLASDAHDSRLASGIRNIGMASGYGLPAREWAKLLDDLAPTRLIVRTPLPAVLRWGIRRRIPTLALLADSFQATSLRTRFERWRIGRLLAHPGISYVANHQRNAARQLVTMGVPADRVIPWDWPQIRSPDELAPKPAPVGGPVRLLYVGGVLRSKGVFDVAEAMPLLAARGIDAVLDVVGKGDLDGLQTRSAEAGWGERVQILGGKPHDTVMAMMRAADLIVIPSHHDYPEGLPMTIYEALCMRTPIVASDHPMFLGNLNHGEAAMIFPEKSVPGIAEAVAAALVPETYAHLSRSSAAAWQAIQIEIKWVDLVDAWLRERADLLRQWTLAAQDGR